MKKITLIAFMLFTALSHAQGIRLNGTVSAENNQIKNLADPIDAQDAVTKNYTYSKDKVDQAIIELQTQITELNNFIDNDSDNFTENDGDCDDSNAQVYPGAFEIEDGLDNNCDGTIDEGVTTTYYADTDGDGFGDAADTVEACAAPTGYVADSADCDDTNATVYPGAPEICDGLDNNCDGNIPADEIDDDGDGYSECEGDCDDGNAAINPDATEVCDGIDNNCDGTIDEGVTTAFYADADGDGFGDASDTVEDCTAPTGYVTDNTDCDDTTPCVGRIRVGGFNMNVKVE